MYNNMYTINICDWSYIAPSHKTCQKEKLPPKQIVDIAYFPFLVCITTISSRYILLRKKNPNYLHNTPNSLITLVRYVCYENYIVLIKLHLFSEPQACSLRLSRPNLLVVSRWYDKLSTQCLLNNSKNNTTLMLH